MTDIPAPEAVDTGFITGFIDRWDEAWNSHDTDRVLALLHPDVLWDEQVFWPTALRGRESVRAYIDAIWKAMPDVSFEEVQRFVAPEGGRGVYMFCQSGSAPAQLEAGDRRYAANGCDIFLGFTDGLLSHYTATYEIAGMLRQLGALPPRGDLLGGAYLLSLTKR